MHILGKLNLPDGAAFRSVHNSPIFDEYQTMSATVLALTRKKACQDDSNAQRYPRNLYESFSQLQVSWIHGFLHGSWIPILIQST